MSTSGVAAPPWSRVSGQSCSRQGASSGGVVGVACDHPSPERASRQAKADAFHPRSLRSDATDCPAPLGDMVFSERMVANVMSLWHLHFEKQIGTVRVCGYACGPCLRSPPAVYACGVVQLRPGSAATISSYDQQLRPTGPGRRVVSQPNFARGLGAGSKSTASTSTATLCRIASIAITIRDRFFSRTSTPSMPSMAPALMRTRSPTTR